MNKEILAKAKHAKSPEELLALAAENGYTLDGEKAKELFERLQSLDELSEDELAHISGGSYGKSREISQYEESYEKIQFQPGGGRKPLQKLPIQWSTGGQTGESGTAPILMYDETPLNKTFRP